jgi:hypothetical protein
MDRRSFIALGLLATGVAALRPSTAALAQTDAGWKDLFNGSSIDDWNKIGDANWKVAEGAIVADNGTGFLLTKESFGDFQLRAEFWADDDANSGIFIRCSDPQKVTAANSYEVNIFDKRPDPSYGTGAIVDIAKVSPMPRAGGKWNRYEIVAKGPQLTVTLNGQRTVENAQDAKFARGPIALQRAAGVIKFRKVQIKTA